MGLLVRLFPTENFSELLSSKFKDGTTVEVFSLRSLLTNMSLSAEHPSLKFCLNQKSVYTVWLQRCMWPEEKGLFWYDKKKLIMAIPQWREEMYLSNMTLKRRVKILVCLFLVPFQERRICAILQQEILGHPEVEILPKYSLYGFPTKPIQWAK